MSGARIVTVGAPTINAGGGGAPGTIRTCNLLIRSQMLYPLSYGRLAGGESNGTASGPPPEGYQRLRTSSAQPGIPSTGTRSPESSATLPEVRRRGFTSTLDP